MGWSSAMRLVVLEIDLHETVDFHYSTRSQDSRANCDRVSQEGMPDGADCAGREDGADGPPGDSRGQGLPNAA